VLLSAADLQTDGTVEARLRSDLTYPDIAKLIPGREGRFCVHMSAQLLKDVAAYVERRVHSSGHTPIRFWFECPDRCRA
jgi:hypothetical protein